MNNFSVMYYVYIILVCFLCFFKESNFANDASENEDENSFKSHLMKLDIPENYRLPEIIIGSQSAEKELIIYFSYTCPHCREFHKNEYPKFKKKYIDTGKIKIIFRNYIDDPGALEAAQLVRYFCKKKLTNSRKKWLKSGRMEEKYINFSTLIFKKQKEWMKSKDPQKFLKNLFNKLGFSLQEIEKCLKQTDISAGLMLEQKRAMGQYGLSSMPAFIYKEQIWIGAVSEEELKNFCELS